MEEQAGRPVAGDPAELQRAIRFVLRNVDAHRGPHGANHAGDMRTPRFLHVGVEKIRAPLGFGVIEPVGESEMPKGDDGFDTRGPHLPRHADVTRECLLVDHARLGFDPGPFDPEAKV